MHHVRTLFVFALLSIGAPFLESADSLGVNYDGSKNNLRADVESADRVVIRTCGVIPAEKAVSHVIMEITGTKEVSEFLKPFGLFGQLEGAASCDCNGDPTFEIYKDEKLVTSFALKHGLCIAWPDAWPHEMFPASKKAIDDLLLTIANKGYPVYMHQKQIMVEVIAYANGLASEKKQKNK